MDCFHHPMQPIGTAAPTFWVERHRALIRQRNEFKAQKRLQTPTQWKAGLVPQDEFPVAE